MSGLIPQAAALGAISPGEERPTQSELGGTLKGGPIQWLLVPFTFPQGPILEFYGSIFVTEFGGGG